jgi:hypothetical protein
MNDHRWGVKKNGAMPGTRNPILHFEEFDTCVYCILNITASFLCFLQELSFPKARGSSVVELYAG